MKKEIVCLSVAETVDILKQHGFSISPVHLRAGIECGAYPFGHAVYMEKSPVYEIFKPLLMKWIEERETDVDDDI